MGRPRCGSGRQGARRTARSVRLVALALAFLVPLALAELVLRALPVADGLAAEPVNAESPVFRFSPNRRFTYSRGWTLDAVHRGRTNNDGFVNDQDYRNQGTTPVVAVVGDSYVEAAMLPTARTVQGHLARALGDRARVYSFAASGAPLSQYLVWMRHAHQAYGAAVQVVVVVGNDFDESLLRYKSAPGFHYFAERGDQLEPVRVDYQPGALRILARQSALARYLLLNLHADQTLAMLIHRLGIAPAWAEDFVGNVAASASELRRRLSERAVDAFLNQVPEATGLPPEKVVFLVDGFRYPWVDPQRTSFFAALRAKFMAEATRRGHAVIDMDDGFAAQRSRDPAVRFEWPYDGHWNALAHGLAAEATLDQPALDLPPVGARPESPWTTPDESAN